MIPFFYCFSLYCIVLYCIVLYCIVLYCAALYFLALYCIVLCCIVLYCIACFVLFCFVLFCFVLFCFFIMRLLHCSVMLLSTTDTVNLLLDINIAYREHYLTSLCFTDIVISEHHLSLLHWILIYSFIHLCHSFQSTRHLPVWTSFTLSCPTLSNHILH